MRKAISLRLAFLCLFVAATAGAQQVPTPAMPYASRQVIPLWDGQVPGTANPAEHESTVEVPGRGIHILRNVTVPTLTVFPAQSANRTKTAVIIAPGGGFRVLAIDEEGYPVAEWFSQHGITAIVLKYRLAFTPGTDQEFAPNLLAPPIPRPSDGAARPGAPPPNALPEEAQKNGIADGIQALKVVRANAAKWGIAADNIVFVGFSAGGVVTCGTMLADNAADRPNFVAPIYGAPFGATPSIPSGAPPAFLAVAEDDPLAAAPVLKFFDALRAAKASPELHVFRSGQHGFSMKLRGTSDHWLDELYWWMESYGLTRP